ncbi:MAG: GNAT family N-acetyltransferase [Pseudomonadota bacterium]
MHATEQIIETERLRLRSFALSDYEALCVLFADSEVMKSSMSGTKTSEEVSAWLIEQVERRGDGIELQAVERKDSTCVIGYCGLSEFSNTDGKVEIQIGYRLIRQYWGNGYATEAAGVVRDFAFTVLSVNRLVALIEPINVRSIAVARKIGMVYEKEVLLEGYDHPDHLYSVCRSH